MSPGKLLWLIAIHHFFCFVFFSSLNFQFSLVNFPKMVERKKHLHRSYLWCKNNKPTSAEICLLNKRKQMLLHFLQKRVQFKHSAVCKCHLLHVSVLPQWMLQGWRLLPVISVVILLVEVNQSQSSNCLGNEVINSPLLDRTVATGSALKILMHELCMRCSFFSLRTEWQGLWSRLR